MRTLILTSRLDTHDTDEYGVRVPHCFGNENGILDTLVSVIKGYDNLLYVASAEDDYEITDMYANLVFKSFDMTLPFKSYTVLDGRTKDVCESVKKADFIILGGGHVPTQNEYFEKIGLRDILSNLDTPVLGISAGSMNMAKLVYCPPELTGEALDKNFKLLLQGLGLTNINVFPHYNDMVDFVLDGLRMMEDIVVPHSFMLPVYVLSDGDYIVQKGDTVTYHGGVRLLHCGMMKRL